MSDDNGDLDYEQQQILKKKKETVLLLTLKRKAELEAKRSQRQEELAIKREQEAIKKESQEQKKLEHKLRREAILEQYRQNKRAAEAAEKDGAGVHSSLGEKASSTGGSATNLSTTNNTQASHHLTIHRSSRDTKSAPSTNHHASAWTLYTGPKLFAKPTTKTNLIIIQNAILKALEGPVNAKTLKRIQDTIVDNSKTCNHFLILFRNRQQFRALLQYDDKQKTITKLDGIGPKNINPEDILKFYKFDSPKRQFSEVQTKHISLTIIAITIQEHLWSKTTT